MTLREAGRELEVGIAARVVVLTVVAALVGVVATPAVAREEEKSFLQSLFERETLTGDWGGLRSTLATHGVDVGFANHGDTFVVVKGGLKRRAHYADLLEPTLALDLEKLVRWPGARMYFRGLGTYGDDDPIDSVGSLHAPSNLAAPDTFTLFEGWLEQQLFGDALSILVGLYALDAEFDVKQTAGVFMNGGFGTGLDLSESGLNGPCIFPVSCLGVRIRVQPAPSVYGQLAVLDGVAGDPDNPRGTRVKLSDDDGALLIAETGYQQEADRGRFLRAALGGWIYTTKVDDLVDVDAEGTPRRRHSWGLYTLLESEIFREAAQSAQGLSGFVRLGYANPDVNQLEWSVGGGLVYTGLIPGRDEDVTGLGVSVGINGGRFKEAQRLADTRVNSQEVALEWTYRIQLLPWMALQLDTQYIINPGTDPSIRDALALGFRYKLTF
jgi:porin